MAGDTIINQTPEAKAVADEVRKSVEPRLLELPNGEKAYVGAGPISSIKKLLDEYLLEPERRKGTSNHVDLNSFLAHVQRHKDESSVVFAAPRGDGGDPTITAIYNYNRAGGEDSATGNVARFGDHRAVYRCPLSDEWKVWSATQNRTFSQQEFAELVEKRILDVADPANAGQLAQDMIRTLGCTLASPAKLMELSRGLAVKVGTAVKRAVNLSSGEAQVFFAEEHADANGAPLVVPSAFLLGIPVFRGGELYQIPVRLRYRVREGGIHWSFDLYRWDLIFDHAFDAACTRVASETKLPVFRGSPEA